MQDITRVALYLSQLNIRIQRIFHSHKLRAEQTARVLFEQLKPLGGISGSDGLSPLDAPALWAERLKNRAEDVMLVGHLPHLARLASLLLCGNADNNPVSFTMAGVICLHSDDAGGWSLQWMLTPGTVIGEKGMDAYCDGL
jgi:phosphohistidine phosphatase